MKTAQYKFLIIIIIINYYYYYYYYYLVFLLLLSLFVHSVQGEVKNVFCHKTNHFTKLFQLLITKVFDKQSRIKSGNIKEWHFNGSIVSF